MTQKSIETRLEVMCTKLDIGLKDIEEINSKLEAGFVRKEEFEPVKRVVYGLVALILVTVVAAMIRMAVK